MRGLRRRSRRFVTVAAAAVLGSSVLAGCGGSGGGGSSSGSALPTINWYIGKQSGGWIEHAAETCTATSGGKYRIKIQDLPSRATDQREQLVRRLGAKDSSIDIIGMDVIWTAEFAGANWLSAFPEAMRAQLTGGVLDGPVASGIYQGKLYGAPFTSNTQLLWYRKDLVPKPATTWQQVISQAAARKMKVQIQGTKAESLTVTFNALLAGAGGRFVDAPAGGQTPAVSLEQGPTQAALTVLHDLAHSSAADPELSQANEDSSRQAFEKGNSLYEINYPFIYPSAAKSTGGKAFQAKIGWARFPQTIAGMPSKPPLGGFNLGVSRYSKHQQAAFEAAACLRGADNQKFAAINGGNAPTLTALYDDPTLRASYPFADELRASINDAAPRPVTPAYNDLSLAVQDTLHPPSSIDPAKDARALRDLCREALKSEAVL